MNLKYYLRGLGIGIVVTALLMGFALKSTKEKLTDDEIMARAEQLGMVESSVLSEDLGNPDETVSENHTEVVKTDSTESEKIEEAEKNEDRLNPTDAGKAEEKKPETTENIDKTDNTKTEVVDNNTESGKKTTVVDNNVETGNAEADKKPDNKETDAAGNSTETEKKETVTAGSGTESDKKETDKNKDKVYTVTIRNGDDSLNVANRLQQMGVIKDAAAFDEYLCKNGYDKHLATGEHKVKAGMSEKELAKELMN